MLKPPSHLPNRHKNWIGQNSQKTNFGLFQKKGTRKEFEKAKYYNLTSKKPNWQHCLEARFVQTPKEPENSSVSHQQSGFPPWVMRHDGGRTAFVDLMSFRICDQIIISFYLHCPGLAHRLQTHQTLRLRYPRQAWSHFHAPKRRSSVRCRYAGEAC